MHRRWSLLTVLTLANVINFYDRTIPAVIVEPLKDEFGLSDTMIGFLGGSFTVVYAIAGVFLGRLADRVPAARLRSGFAVVAVVVAGLMAWQVVTGQG